MLAKFCCFTVYNSSVTKNCYTVPNPHPPKSMLSQLERLPETVLLYAKYSGYSTHFSKVVVHPEQKAYLECRDRGGFRGKGYPKRTLLFLQRHWHAPLIFPEKGRLIVWAPPLFFVKTVCAPSYWIYLDPPLCWQSTHLSTWLAHF